MYILYASMRMYNECLIPDSRNFCSGMRRILRSVCCGQRDRAARVFHKAMRATRFSTSMDKSERCWPSPRASASRKHSDLY